MKITAKTSKEQLVQFLGANEKSVKKQDKDLFSRLTYATKMMATDENKVTKKDLVDLAREVMKLLGSKIAEPVLAEETPAEETPVEPKAENSVKGSKKKAKKEEVPAESTEDEVETEDAEEKVDTKKSAKKSLGKKKAKDGDTDSSKKTVQTKALVLAEVFPDEFEVNDHKYVKATDIANMGQLYDALSEDEEQTLVFAMYWTKRHIKQFGYGVDTLKVPKEFPMDLDLATCIYVSDESTIAYAVSAYTEACYMFKPNDLEEVDGMRYSAGVEFQIYRMVE